MIQYKKVAFYTLGCKLNFSETSGIAQNFEKGGFAKVEFEEQPDVFVINTCSVTENADKKCRNIVRKAKKINPKAYVAVIGCYAQLKPKDVSKIEGVNLVLGANEKFNILAHVEKLEKENNEKAVVLDGDIEDVHEFFPSFSIGDRTRTFLKVQDGCDYSCSFCTIPLARGKSRSNTLAETMLVAKDVAKSPAKEVVLTGVNLGDFGRYNNEDFHGLVKELDGLDGIERFRISSIEPNLLTNEIIETVASGEKFVPHFHIPLQSGSPDLLRSMRRRYKRELYTSRVKKIKELMPHCCIGVDVIVGFPGETEDKFMETYDYLNEIDISYLHVFTYSERENTLAPELENSVNKKTRDERSKKLRILSYRKKRAFYQENIGKSFPVLFEAEKNNDFMFGFTSNYVKVKTEYSESLINEIKMVTLKEIDRDGLFLIDFN